jgi:hypothetical protein
MFLLIVGKLLPKYPTDSALDRIDNGKLYSRNIDVISTVKIWNDGVTARPQISPFGLYAANPTWIYYRSKLDFIRFPAYRIIVCSIIQPTFTKEF